ncbi:hypothetical protein KCA24_23150, partial [Escherichia coli]|nr:hypothetical protein [Escherichia coli]
GGGGGRGGNTTRRGKKKGGGWDLEVIKGEVGGGRAPEPGKKKQTREIRPTLLTQIDTRLNQLLNRYVILLDTKVEQSQ